MNKCKKQNVKYNAVGAMRRLPLRQWAFPVMLFVLAVLITACSNFSRPDPDALGLTWEASESETGGSASSLTDLRDGTVYSVVRIGSARWMTRNLQYASTTGSWCYNDLQSICASYGRLYDWNTAQTACPSGTHLPSSSEWTQLIAALSDIAAFSIQLAGKYSSFDASALGGPAASYMGLNANAYYWSSTGGNLQSSLIDKDYTATANRKAATQAVSTYATGVYAWFNGSSMTIASNNVLDRYSVRCVAD